LQNFDYVYIARINLSDSSASQ